MCRSEVWPITVITPPTARTTAAETTRSRSVRPARNPIAKGASARMATPSGAPAHPRRKSRGCEDVTGQRRGHRQGREQHTRPAADHAAADDRAGDAAEHRGGEQADAGQVGAQRGLTGSHGADTDEAGEQRARRRPLQCGKLHAQQRHGDEHGDEDEGDELDHAQGRHGMHGTSVSAWPRLA